MFLREIFRTIYGERHVRLARAEPHFADEHVAHGEGVLALGREGEWATGLQRVEVHPPFAIRAGLDGGCERREWVEVRTDRDRRLRLAGLAVDGEAAENSRVAGEVDRLLDWCGEQGFVFATQSAQMEKMPNLELLRNAKYQALVDKIIARRKGGTQPINGTPKTIETLLRFHQFECYPTMFPRVYPNGDVFYPCEPLRKIAGNLLRDKSLRKIFANGKKLYGDIPPCQGICYLFGNVLSHYYVNDFWGLAGDFIQ